MRNVVFSIGLIVASIGQADQPAQASAALLIEQANLIASDGGPNTRFASSVAISGDTALIGAPSCINQCPPSSPGAAYVMTRDTVTGAWNQQARLVPGDSAAGDEFGSAVLIHGDMALIGAMRAQVGGNNQQGAVYVFERDPGSGHWNEQAKLTASDGQALHRFGISMAWSEDTLLIGANGVSVDGNFDQGAVYVFNRDPGGGAWMEQGRLTASEGAQQDSFGSSVAIAGNIAVVGAPVTNVNGNARQGKAYIYEFDPGTGEWNQRASLAASDGALNAGFGQSVAIAADAVLIGAPGADIDGDGRRGAAYVYVNDDGVWVEQDKLAASDGSRLHGFGNSIAADGDVALIGADNAIIGANDSQGAVYVWARDSSGHWNQQGKLIASDGSNGDEFGASLAFGDGRFLIGAPETTVSGSERQGRAYVFGPPAPGLFLAPQQVDFGSAPIGGSVVRELTLFNTDDTTINIDGLASPGAPFDTTGGSCGAAPFALLAGEHCTVELSFEPNDPGPMLADLTITSDTPGSPDSAALFGTGAAYTAHYKLIAADGQSGDEFKHVAIDGDRALVGAPRAGSQGAAYVFARDPVSGFWQQQARLDDPDSAFSDNFGASVALIGDFALVGAPGLEIDGHSSQGVVYVFQRDLADGSWEEQGRLAASVPGGGGFSGVRFGSALSVDGNTLLIGASGADNGEGAAYVFTYDAGTGEWLEQAKLNADNDVPSSFGVAVALHDDRAVIGASATNVDGNALRGAAYVFEQAGGQWTQQARLIAADGQNLDRFGISVALSGESALVGAPATLNAGRPGAAYLFERDSSTGDWNQQAKISAAGINNQFGSSVLLADDRALIGATHQHVGGHLEAGSVYLFERNSSNGQWQEQLQLSAHDARQMDNFGISLAASGDTVLVGAQAQVDGMLNRGAAYVFTTPNVASGLSIAPAEVTFSPVATGETDGPRSVTLINADGTAISVSAIGPASAAFSAVGGSCGELPFSLEPGGSCALNYVFNPDGEGDFLDVIEVTSDASSSPDSFTLSGAVLDRELSVSPAVVDFGLVDVGESGGPLSVELSNTGMLDVTLEPVQSPGGAFVLSDDSCGATNPLPTVLPVGQTCVLQYRFNPSAVGHAQAQVSIVSDAPSSPDVISLEGTGSGAVIELSPDSLSVPVPEGQTRTQSVSVANTGNQALEWEITEAPGTGRAIQRPAGMVTIPRTRSQPVSADGYITAPEPASGSHVPPRRIRGDGVTISHSDSLDIMDENSLACGSSSGTSAASYLRTFTLTDFGIGTEFEVTEVAFGIQSLTASTPITVNLHTLEGDFIFANLTQIGTATETLSSQQLTLVTVPVTGTVPVGATLVVEIAIPDLVPQQAGFFPGSNDQGESAPSYAAAPTCGTVEPTPFADLGAPQIHLVMAVTGEVTDCELPPWMAVEPAEGTVASSGQQSVTVTLDATATPVGEYDANLCFASNDPVGPLRTIPVSLSVTGQEPKPEPGKLIAADGASNDWFGRSVAVDGDTVLVSADAADIGGNTNQGAVYVFVREGDHWLQQAKLVADDGAQFDQFGFSVALSGDTALIGSGGANAAYVFTRDMGVWSQQARFSAADTQPNDNFGIAVALEGDTALIGARQAVVNGNFNQGAAYVFTRSGDIWTEQAKLTASDGEAYNVFGDAVALSGDTAIVGAAFHNTNGQENQGAAYVYVRSGENWTEQAKLIADDGRVNDWFGNAVAVLDDTAVIAASQINIPSEPGAAYVFTRSGESWAQDARLTSSDGQAGDTFGESVAMSGDAILIGALFTSNSEGAAYLFARDDEIWDEQDRLGAEDGVPGDQFGKSVAMAGNLAVIGAWTADVDGNANQGAAYVFELDITPPLKPGVLVVDPVHLDLGEIAVGDSHTAAITVTNAAETGAAEALILAGIDLVGDGAFAIVGGSCQAGVSLPPQESCTIQIGFSPDTERVFDGELSVTSDDGQAGSVEVTGIGYEPSNPEEVIFSDRFE